MSNQIEKTVEALKNLTTHELVTEVIENGYSRFIESLAEFEPIPLMLLFDEGSKRTGRKIDSSDSFFEVFLRSDISDLDPEVKSILMRAVKIKEIERKHVSEGSE